MVEWHEAWTTTQGRAEASTLFAQVYRAEPDEVWAAPGRVNLIGEHTDYNGGLCLPIALPHRTYVAARRRDDDRVRLVSDLDPSTPWEGRLGDLAPGTVSGWVAYCGGPAWALRQDGFDVPGFDVAVASCVPLGAGLSSSAAVECAVGLALASLTGRPLDGSDTDRKHVADLCVRAENEVAQAPTGGMDQAASVRTAAGQALLLDCLDGSTTDIPFDLAAAGLELLVIDTRATHSLDDGQYGARRASCEAAARRLGVQVLREVADLDTALARLDDDIEKRRTRHVLNEIRRVEEFVEAARAKEWARAGELMNASHDSLADDYEVSCRELDIAVASSRRAGALGARMTGGGFGGSAITLVESAQIDTVAAAVLGAAAEHGLPTPQLHRVVPSEPGGRVA